RPTLNIAIALVLGAMIGVGIAFLLEYFDTTIRTEEDLEEKLGITIIGTVSTIDASDVQGGQRSRATNVNPTQPNEGRRSHAKRNKNNVKASQPRRIISKLNPRSPITEQYRTIRTNLQFSSIDEDITCI